MRTVSKPFRFTSAIFGVALAMAIAPEPALAYIDPTAAGAFLQSLYIAMASAVLFVAALPHKVAAMVRSVKARLMPGSVEPAPTPEQETPKS